MFAKLKQWFCSKVCQPKYDAAQIRQDLSDIIYGIDAEKTTYKQTLFDSAMRDMYRDYAENAEPTYLSLDKMNEALHGDKREK